MKNIEKDYSYHKSEGTQPERYQAIRDKAKELAYLIEKSVPDSREKSLAFTDLEQAVMWANAGIARNENPIDPPIG
jgi:hypothetical protein